MSLVYAFTLAGSQSVLVTLWNIPDRETSQLMEDFYREVLSPEASGRAEVLRNAQRRVRRMYSCVPFRWGAFALFGDHGQLSLGTRGAK